MGKDDGELNSSKVSKKIVDQRIAYWIKRLDDTLSFTRNATTLIYTVDGAGIAVLYFAFQSAGITRTSVLLASVPLLFLTVVNTLHARFMVIQHSWYSGIDDRLVKILQEKPIVHRKSREILSSTHGIFMLIHGSIAAFLFIVTILFVLYGVGFFPDLVLARLSAA